jgi:hypothetical protein
MNRSIFPNSQTLFMRPSFTMKSNSWNFHGHVTWNGSNPETSFRSKIFGFRNKKFGKLYEKTMYGNTSAKRECFHTLFSSAWISRWDTSSSCLYASNFACVIKIFDENTSDFHQVSKYMASCDQIGDYHWLNCLWIINDLRSIYR